MNYKDNRKIEGYWYEEYTELDKTYPMPIPNVLSEKEAEEIYNLIKEKETAANVVRYRGYSASRITGERLGSAEFATDEWIWPDYFAKHYVLTHKVKPTDAFLKYIGYENF